MSTVTTTTAAGQATGIAATTTTSGAATSRWRSSWLPKSRLYLVLYLLMLPTIVTMIVFSYYPKFATIKYAFYFWDGQMVEDFVGLANFRRAFKDNLFWQTFQLVLILLAANAIKMWPSIFTAIVMHRVRSERWQYLYRVLFVIPMVIPGMVWLLIWKSFFDPTSGILNKFLNNTGLMGVLSWLDHAMPALASNLAPARGAVVDMLFGNVWGLAIFGAMLLLLAAGTRTLNRYWAGWTLLPALGWGAWTTGLWAWAHPSLVVLVTGLAIVVAVLLLFVAGTKPLNSYWIGWALALLAGWWAWQDRPELLVMVPAVAVVVAALAHRAGPLTGPAILKWAGAACIGLAFFFVMATMIWTAPINQFDAGTPAWLGHQQLVIPSIIFWGFPWVGTVGVLIYLAGLQTIPQDVYEAAELDGVGSVGRLFRIELPLIMTQVRINLIFMTIGTLTDYGLFFLLLGPEGGPGNAGMVPGLYMYSEAFVQGDFGYACALGMVMFVLILAITVLYQKYVKVEK